MPAWPLPHALLLHPPTRPSTLPYYFIPPRRKDKERENSAALEVLPDLLTELDEMAPPQRLLALVQVGETGMWHCGVALCRGMDGLA